MNKQRRKIISECVIELEKIRDTLEDVKCDEEMAFDSLPENLQGSIRGEEMEEAIETLDSSIEQLNDAIDGLGGI